jgi:predicted DNA-binding transcriptional regulator YafY
MPTAKSKTLVRVMSMMQLIPVYPRWTTAKRLLTALDSRGFSVSKGTVERDLVELGDVFSLISSDVGSSDTGVYIPNLGVAYSFAVLFST